MKWKFEPRSGGDAAARDDDGGDSAPAPGSLGLPAALLERHGARVLHPAHAVRVAGYPRPRSTVYRATTLLVPGDLLRKKGFVKDVNQVLRRVGLKLVTPGKDVDADLDTSRADRQVLEALARLPQVAVLVPRKGHGRPVEVDAWKALQVLRAAAAPRARARKQAAADPEEVRLDPGQVARIELEHLTVGSALITGDPAGSVGGGGITGGPGGSSNGGEPGITDSYLFSGDSRTPVAVLLDPPWRLPASDCTARFGRRPVVAVLDTGVRAHPWLDVAPDGSGGYTMPAGSFVTTDAKIQAKIFKRGKWAASKGGKRRQVIKNAWDKPVTGNRLIGELGDASGHSTFIAGIVRQVAPDATVLAVRVMGSDDVAYTGDIICALHHLAKRIASAEPGDLAAEVDVLSLSFGFFSESHHKKMMNSGLWKALEVLISLGVIVVAAAGNYASKRKFYPAAFALQPVPAGVPVMSVGALNPNGTKAMFSNDGDWVTAWAPGAHVVSTYPVDIDGSETPALRTPVNRAAAGEWPQGRESLDPDDFGGGFSLWSGTSFSAPCAAALVVRSLLAGAQVPGAGLRLDTLGTAARCQRAVAAYGDLPQSIE